MMSDDDQELATAPLSVLFSRAQAFIKHGPSQDPSATRRALATLTRCQGLIDSAGIFSANEEQDDISTADLKYLLVPFYMAELLSSSSEPDLTQRLSSVGRAATLYSAFLHRCSSYDLMGRIAKALYDREEDGAPLDASMLRMSKVERFKRDRAIAQELEQLEQQGAATAAAERDAEESSVDEEVWRQLWLLQVEGSALRALEQRGMLRQEMQLLRHALERQAGSAGAGSSQAQRQAAAQEREVQQRMVQQLQGIAGQLESRQREALRQAVFRPSHMLPTLTVEQQGMIELAEAQERQRRQDEAAAAQQAAQEQQGSDEEEDQELARQRAWDDFKDDNPRGAGNSKLRPCA